ncbi:MAG: esterase-like activity of phytase family protein [Labilithrix sp.]|nr:esterase-like activity of phytase family protein [Labilithrix sp.]
MGIWTVFDLPDDPRSRELSGIAWDPSRRVLFAVQDETANIVPLEPHEDFHRWTLGTPIPLSVPGKLDTEGIVIVDDGFIVASEIGPRIIEVDRVGRFRRDVALPAKFSEALGNKSFESLSASPDGRYLYTASETALPRDAGARVRILRLDRKTGEAVEHAYATDVAPRDDYGVADLAAFGAEELLVLERGWTQGVGNAARIHRTSLADASAICHGVESLAADAPVLAKTLLVDLERLPLPSRLPPPKQPQPTPLMDNYEGIALGPPLPDGRRALFLVSDDNGRSDQFSRIVVLAVG